MIFSENRPSTFRDHTLVAAIDEEADTARRQILRTVAIETGPELRRGGEEGVLVAERREAQRRRHQAMHIVLLIIP